MAKKLTEKIMKKKIKDYNNEITEKFYTEVLNEFIKKAKKKYSNYKLLKDDDTLKIMLENSEFKDFCYSDIGFVMRETPQYWANKLIKDFDEIIDFEKLKQDENIELNFDQNDSIFCLEDNFETINYIFCILKNKHKNIGKVKTKHYNNDTVDVFKNKEETLIRKKKNIITSVKNHDFDYVTHSKINNDMEKLLNAKSDLKIVNSI